MNILLAAFVLTALAQPMAERPEFRIGDRWAFTIQRANGSTEEWTREIIGFAPDGRIRALSNSGTVLLYDASLNLIGAEGARPGRSLGSVRYPLKLGDRWSVERSWSNVDWAEAGSATVAAYEEITVPAGTFACYRVEADSTVSRRLFSERRVSTRWYCPAIKFIAKEVATTTTFDPSNPVNNGARTETSELRSFVAGR